MIKAMALDIDGTITDQTRKLDITAIEPIRKAEANGIKICLATGNILCFARTAAVMLGTSGPLIAEDGGVIFDQKRNEKYVLTDSKEFDKAIDVLEREFDNIQHTTTSHRRKAGRTLERTFDTEKANKILADEGLNVTAVDSGFAIHVRSSDVNKGEGLKKAASILGYSPSEIAAMGDGENDIEMLKVSGLSFTPANANPKTKAASNRTTKNSYGKGVEETIDFILENR